MTKRAEVTIRTGDMVVCPGGRVGLAIVRTGYPRVAVQFGGGGPWKYYAPTSLRRATADEIRDAGLYGVGCNEPLGGW